MGLRPLDGRQCHHCGSAAPPRRPRPDDRVVVPEPGLRAARPIDAAVPEPARQAPSADLLERAARLPAATHLHIPVAMREKLARILADSLVDMLRAEDGREGLERVRTKLLLATPPKGVSLRPELEERVRLWNGNQWEELYARVAEQARLRGT